MLAVVVSELSSCKKGGLAEVFKAEILNSGYGAKVR